MKASGEGWCKKHAKRKARFKVKKYAVQNLRLKAEGAFIVSV
jgi:hypothetical protein